MSTLPQPDPFLGDAAAADAIDMIIVPRLRDIGPFSVKRALPAFGKQMVGPFIFLDTFGPGEVISAESFDVRPHPHIGLATVTYLMNGEIVHRDSVGSQQSIVPGDVNWMTAGKGIAHSERAPAELPMTVHGFQTWVALPKEHEEASPTFFHHGHEALPVITGDGITVRLAIGSMYGQKAPTETFTDMFFADVVMNAGSHLPLDASHEERAAFLSEGTVEIGGDTFEPGRLIVFKPGEGMGIRAKTDARLILLGGEPMDGRRQIWWNFVSSSKERIQQAKEDWKMGRFDKVFGDESDFIPLPE